MTTKATELRERLLERDKAYQEQVRTEPEDLAAERFRIAHEAIDALDQLELDFAQVWRCFGWESCQHRDANECAEAIGEEGSRIISEMQEGKTKYENQSPAEGWFDFAREKDKENEQLKAALHDQAVWGRSSFKRDPANCSLCGGFANAGEFIDHEEDCLLHGYEPEVDNHWE